MNDDHELTIIRVDLMIQRFMFMFGLRSNSFIGDQFNHIQVMVTMMTLLVVWITINFNPIGPLATKVYVFHRALISYYRSLGTTPTLPRNG